MGLVRTNITLPAEVLAQLDDIVGPRGRSRYISDLVTRAVRREHARRVWEERAGALKDSTSWGSAAEETDRIIREMRREWDEAADRKWERPNR